MDNYINLTHESRKVVRAEQFLSMRNREGVYRVFWTGCPLSITAYTTLVEFMNSTGKWPSRLSWALKILAFFI